MDKSKTIIVFFLVVILAGIIGFNIYKHKLSKVESVKAQIEEEKKKNEILEVIAILERKVEEYQERSFATTEITQLLDRISELAQETGLKIETFNPAPLIEKEHYTEMALEIPLQCDYHKLGELLSLIESNEEFIWVKKLQMHRSTAFTSGASTIPKTTLTISGLYLEK